MRQRRILKVVNTVAETQAYLAASKAAGMSDGDRTRVVDLVARNPEAGDLIVGSGGCRKIRVAGRGRGKSGGYRVVTYFSDVGAPVYLLSAISKGSAANFSATEIQAMAAVARLILAARKGR